MATQGVAMGRAIAVRTDYTAGEVRRRGGINKVLPGADYKQAALSPEAFTEIFTFITGPPKDAGFPFVRSDRS